MVDIGIESAGKCCFTGYRPTKFPFKLRQDNINFQKFQNDLLEVILKLAAQNCRTFYTGMAMGFDIIAAETVLSVQNAFERPLELICVLPFKQQSNNYPEVWKKRFQNVIGQSQDVIVLSEKYYAGCYHVRNRYMVDHSDYVITWYDGRPGGTKNTVDYALKIGRQVFNVCDEDDVLAYQTKFEIL
ncbi:MAG: SLOG family protein [Acutalibacteraceae bacterium]|jgi:uncharacterized phage-like protein YoqJ